MLQTSIDASALKNPKLKKRELQNLYKEITAAPVFKPVVRKGDTIAPVSKYFGLPWLAKDEEWPVLHDVNPTFVLQLDVKTLPGRFPEALGGTGLLQFFYEATNAGDWDNSALVRLVYPEGADTSCEKVLAWYDPKEHATEAFQDDTAKWVPKIIKDWATDTDYPRFEELEALAGDLSDVGPNVDSEPDEYLDACLQGDKLGGWPFWTQGVETPVDKNGRSMIYVMQIDAGCFFDGRKFPAHAPELFAGDGTGHIFVSETDPTELKFNWACG